MADIIKILEKYGMVFIQGLGGTLWISLITVLFGTLLGRLLH